jgi:hypothetical protein
MLRQNFIDDKGLTYVALYIRLYMCLAEFLILRGLQNGTNWKKASTR